MTKESFKYFLPRLKTFSIILAVCLGLLILSWIFAALDQSRDTRSPSIALFIIELTITFAAVLLPGSEFEAEKLYKALNKETK